MSNEDKAREAVEHLQAAALEMIAATRAVLDLAEDLVQDPGPLLGLLGAVGDFAARARPPDADEGPERAPRVQHIRVS